MKVALDTTYILGRGAVKDTYNLLSDSIVKFANSVGSRGKRACRVGDGERIPRVQASRVRRA